MGVGAGAFPKEEYELPFFKELGYVRKPCPKCGESFWTQNEGQETCGEAAPSGCARYTFIGNPPMRKSYDLREMREAFLSFFEERGHTRIKPYPVVARWRDDVYLTHASIIDFQPYVTDGITPPPANPLVIVQPCIRLVDIANTGPTFGKHLTIFEMGGHHAFNYPDKEVYWKDRTVRYYHEFATECLGVRSEEITYKEGVWVGGGNAGPDVECIIRGLEVATLVFMQYKVVGNGFVKLPIRTVDTGYGIERLTWLSQGTPSCVQAVYGGILEKIFDMAGISEIDNETLAKVAEASGLISLDKGGKLEARRMVAEAIGVEVSELDKWLSPIENAFAAVDHTKCLTFMLSEGVIPSNVREGYLARLLLRRVYRLLKMLGIQDKLHDIVDLQIDFWSNDYPHLKDARNEIMEMLYVEGRKFEEAIKRGSGLIKRVSADLRAGGFGEIPTETLVELYDSHGLPPEIVKEVAEGEGLTVNVPENFYALIAQKHMQATGPISEGIKPEAWLEEAVTDVPETEQLYYKDQYAREFEAKVLKVINDRYVILDKTCFYPEGGGQLADNGYLLFGENSVEVVDVQKVGKVIVHKVSAHGNVPMEGDIVKGVVDWERRYSLMKGHTATHIINGAARRVLGQHVWQLGTQKGVESSRLDISHYRRLTQDEVHEIEVLANQTVSQNVPVEVAWMPRNEAEKLYGFRLYQGGAVLGNNIRVVKIGDWDVEACAGTHVKSTGEIGFIKITHSERVQDGVERLTYSVGIQALKAVQKNERLLHKLSEILNAPLGKLDKTAEKIVKELKEANAERRRLIKELAARESASLLMGPVDVKEVLGVKLLTHDFQGLIDVNRMVQTANEVVKRDEAAVVVFYGTDGKVARIMVVAGEAAVKMGVDASEVAKEASAIIGGSGGGKPNFAQGGGVKVEKLQEAVKKAEEVLRRQLKAGKGTNCQ